MLNFRKIIKNIAIYAVAFCVTPKITSAVDFYAKVVFIGAKHSGKTTLFNLLTEQKIDLNYKESTLQINADGLIVNVKAKGPKDKEEKSYEIQVVLNDCPVEDFVSEGAGMRDFYTNANVVFLMLNARDYLTIEGMTRNGEKLDSGLFLQNPKNEKMMLDFTKLFSNCRTIVVLTQLEALSTPRNTRELTKNLIEFYIDKVLKQGKFGNNIDGSFNITLKDKDSKDERNKYLISLIEALKKSLVKCVEEGRLSNQNVMMTAKLKDKKIVDRAEKKFLFWVTSEEQSHTVKILDNKSLGEFKPTMKRSSTTSNLFGNPLNNKNSKK